VLKRNSTAFKAPFQLAISECFDLDFVKSVSSILVAFDYCYVQYEDIVDNDEFWTIVSTLQRLEKFELYSIDLHIGGQNAITALQGKPLKSLVLRSGPMAAVRDIISNSSVTLERLSLSTYADIWGSFSATNLLMNVKHIRLELYNLSRLLQTCPNLKTAFLTRKSQHGDDIISMIVELMRSVMQHPRKMLVKIQNCKPLNDAVDAARRVSTALVLSDGESLQLVVQTDFRRWEEIDREFLDDTMHHTDLQKFHPLDRWYEVSVGQASLVLVLQMNE